MTDTVEGEPRAWNWPGPGRAARMLAAAEMSAAFVLFELDLWYFGGQPPGGPRIAVLAALLAILGFSGLRRSIWSWPGPRGDRGGAWVEALAWTAALGLTLLVGSLALYREYEGLAFGFLVAEPRRFPGWLGQKALEAGGQQLVLQCFIAPLSLVLLGRRRASAVLAAAIFGVLHLPSRTLAAVTAASALVWIGLFRRRGFIGPLIVSHMLLATLAYGVLPYRLSLRLRVGVCARGDLTHYATMEAPPAQAFLRELAAPGVMGRLWGGDAAACVQDLFRLIFGRPATLREIRSGVAELDRVSPGRLAAALMNTDEYRLRESVGAPAPWDPPARRISVLDGPDRDIAKGGVLR